MCTQSLDDLFHTLLTIWEKEYFIICTHTHSVAVRMFDVSHRNAGLHNNIVKSTRVDTVCYQLPAKILFVSERKIYE